MPPRPAREVGGAEPVRRVRLEWQRVGEQRVHHHAHSPDVRRGRPHRASHHLRRGVPRGAKERAVSCGLVHVARVAEVAQLDFVSHGARVDEHILQLDIAVDHLQAVQMPQRGVELADHREDRLLAQRALALQQLLAVAARHHVHHDGALALRLEEGVGLHDALVRADLLEERRLPPEQVREAAPHVGVALALREFARVEPAGGVLPRDVDARGHAVAELRLQRVLLVEGPGLLRRRQRGRNAARRRRNHQRWGGGAVVGGGEGQRRPAQGCGVGGRAGVGLGGEG
mmetsp:Transcript_9775/g.23617  ORF Transcript_9775/g.23617 Transcript_9775/m.23617 type:complete len:286 (+) Transcript_9775:1325-2182(+)